MHRDLGSCSLLASPCGTRGGWGGLRRLGARSPRWWPVGTAYVLSLGLRWWLTGPAATQADGRCEGSRNRGPEGSEEQDPGGVTPRKRPGTAPTMVAGEGAWVAVDFGPRTGSQCPPHALGPTYLQAGTPPFLPPGSRDGATEADQG